MPKPSIVALRKHHVGQNTNWPGGQLRVNGADLNRYTHAAPDMQRDIPCALVRHSARQYPLHPK